MRRLERLAPCLGFAALLAAMLVVMGAASPSAYGQGRSIGSHGLLPEFNPWASNWYVRMEYMGLWSKGSLLPPLLTTSPSTTPREDAGVLGEPGTEILFGGERAKDNGHQGARLTFGHWLDPAQTLSAEVEWWILAEASLDNLVAASDGSRILARPFFNTEPGVQGQDAQLIAYPGLIDGSIQATARTVANSATALLRGTVHRGPHGYVDVLGGYRYFRYRESLAVSQQLLSGLFTIEDKWVTENDFHGAELGAVVGVEHGAWLVELTTKVALGDMHEQLHVSGSTAGLGAEQPGGWLTAPSNIGRHSDHDFSAIPTIGLHVTHVAFDVIRLTVGYNLIYATKVLRIGDQIDTVVNPGQLAGLPLARGTNQGSGRPRPGAALDDTSIWFQGITFGAELRW